MRLSAGLRAATLLIGGLLATSATAATLNESDAPGGAFGSSWANPTEVGAGFDAVAGTGAGNAFDNFVFTALPSGRQTLSFAFQAPAGIDYSYSAGGQLLWSTEPFRYGWDGKQVGSGFQLGHWQPQTTVDLELGDDFSGKLFLALNFTHGSSLAYNISVPSNAVAGPGEAAPVPLPAGLLLIGTGIAALGAARLRRRRPATA
jgi:hypothetical protein